MAIFLVDLQISGKTKNFLTKRELLAMMLFMMFALIPWEEMMRLVVEGVNKVWWEGDGDTHQLCNPHSRTCLWRSCLKGNVVTKVLRKNILLLEPKNCSTKTLKQQTKEGGRESHVFMFSHIFWYMNDLQLTLFHPGEGLQKPMWETFWSNRTIGRNQQMRVL